MPKIRPLTRPVIGDRRLLGSALLVTTLILSGVVGWASIRSARDRMAATRLTLQDHADFAAMMLAARTYRQLGDLGTQLIAFWRPGHAPVVPPELACADGNPYFEARPGGRWRVTQTTAAPDQLRFLTDSLLRDGQGIRLLEQARWRLRFVRDAGGPGEGYFIFRRDGVIGVRVCLMGKAQLGRLLQAGPILPANAAGALPAESLLSVVMTSGGDRPLSTFGAQTRSPYHASAPVGADLFGDLTVHVTLEPALARRLILQRLPVERTPFVLGLLLLSGVLVAFALVQVRREYRLIAERAAFVANVSHELRTPLAQVLLFTELLSLDRLRSEAERRRALGIIDQETRRLIRLVENVLQFSRAGSVHTPLARTPVDLASSVEGTIDVIRPLADARQATIVSAIPTGSGCLADRGALRQILLNLLDNAVKYGPAGQTIRVSAMGADGRVRLVVADEGPGIPAPERERIWEGHYRLPRDAEGAVGGTGLGLAVVRALATELGGSAWVDPGPGRGARFVVELPAAPSAAS